MFEFMKKFYTILGKPPDFRFENEKTMTDKGFIEEEIKRWIMSPVRKMMIDGERYYRGDHDILNRKRTAIGENGELEEIKNLPNNIRIDNQYAKMVNQKTNYLLGQPLTFDTANEDYQRQLSDVFGRRFQRVLKNASKNALCCGIGWLYPYINEDGKLIFASFKPYEILPFWKNSEHTELDMAIRMYDIEVYEDSSKRIKHKVEIYYKEGVGKYEFYNGQIIPDKDAERTLYNYINIQGTDGSITSANWGRVPLLPVKYNEAEIPLIKKVKSLQDGINLILSNFENNMEEDCRNTILIIKNYDGQNLGEFRRNLATYGAVKVKTVDGADGGVDALQVEVNAENYKSILEIFKKALIENAMGFDAKDDRLSGNPNQMNIQSMYSDIDLDANEMETELQALFEDLLEMANMYLENRGQGKFSASDVNVIFNRDMLMNESEIIENCQKSVGILSDETIVANHPFTADVKAELERKKAEKQEAIDDYGAAFRGVNTAGGLGGE